MTEQSFTISIPESKLDHLHAKLDLVTWPDELEDAGTTYGAPLADIQRLAARWRNGYDWRKHEAALNAEMPQFTRDIEVKDHGTLNIHYVHQKSSDVANAIPLLFRSRVARKLPRSAKSASSLDSILARPSQLPRRSDELAWVWVFRGSEKAGICT